jgi:hypothetical protein
MCNKALSATDKAKPPPQAQLKQIQVGSSRSI